MKVLIQVDSTVSTSVPVQVFLAPNFRAVVSRSAYKDPAHPDITLVDLVESSAEDAYIF